MSNDKTPGDYEVGYGKPPKNTQFQKGISGNPKGRPKKSLNFDHELIRESNSLMTINENGQRKRIRKLRGMVKQLTNKAVSGNMSALRTCVTSLQQAHERVALVADPQPSDPGRYNDVTYLSDEELMRIAAGGREKTE
jgi:Family of unknown function (DUF5681)